MMPPPISRAILLLMMLFVIVVSKERASTKLAIPPPKAAAVLLLIMVLSMLIKPLFSIPPPLESAELSPIVLSVMVNVPPPPMVPLAMPPPKPAELLLMLLSVTVTLGSTSIKIPPPIDPLALPFVMVIFFRVTEKGGPLLPRIEKTEALLLPSTIVLSAPAPLTVRVLTSMVTFSLYVPAATLIVSPELAALTAP